MICAVLQISGSEPQRSFRVKSMQIPTKTLISTVVLGLISSATATAGGFSLYTEGNGYSIGNFGAGVAAEAKDASTTWFNPAGLALIKDKQAVLAGVGVFPTAKLKNGRTNFTVTTSAGASFSSPGSFSSISGGENGFVPSGYFAMPLGENATFGIGFLAPFGLSTNWDSQSPVRYAATFSELLTFNVTPSIGGNITENIAVGAGIDLQYSRVKFNSIVGNPVLAQLSGFPATAFDSLSYNRGRSTAVGFHGGVLGHFNDNHTRVGLNYQSKVKHKFNGFSQLSGALASANGISSGKARNNNLNSNAIEFPEITTLSVYQDVSPKVAILGSAVYTGWHVLRNIQLNNIVAGFPGGLPAPISQPFTAVSKSVENYKNTWRFALGTNVKVDENALLRLGVGYDQSPTRDNFRTVRLPDEDRWALSIGGSYDYDPSLSFDIGYTYLWAPTDPTINKTNSAGVGSTFTVQSSGKARAHLVGLQANWKMDAVAPSGKGKNKA